MKEKLEHLRKCYITNRQIGLSEAVYRLIPSMTLKFSTVTCIFVSTGFPENRSQFLKRVAEENEDQMNKSNLIGIDGSEGLFEKSVTMHERYAGRPVALNNICLAQFAVSYVLTDKFPKNVEMNQGASLQTGRLKLIYGN